MAEKTPFIMFLIGCIFLILGIIITIIFLLIDSEEKKMPEKEESIQYDSYIFSIIWPPSSCYSNNLDNEFCFNTTKTLNKNDYFTIHGLWPTYKSGKYPEICNKNEEIKINFEEDDYKKTLSSYWPELHSSEINLWNQEYNKQGYCYIQKIGKNPKKDYKLYFDKAMEIHDEYGLLMEEILPNLPKGLYNISKTKFKKILLESSQHLDPSTYSLICVKNESNKTDILNEIRFNYNLNFTRKNNNISTENCPEKFQIFFNNNTRRIVYQVYDSFILTLLWNPVFCYKKGKQCYKRLKEKELNIFMIHGLWPSLKSGQELQWCNIDEDIQVEIKDFPDDLKNNITNYWIGVENSDKELWNYVYNKYGYCYIQKIRQNVTNSLRYFQLTVDEYNRNDAKNIFKEIFPNIFPGLQKINTSYFQEKLNEKYGANTYGLNCIKLEDKYFLKEIRLKLDIVYKLMKEGDVINNCPEEFYVEILEVEGPQKQAEGFYEVYDMYFFTILWLGTTCHMKGEQCYENIANVPKNTFTIHGLWPNLRNGTLADWCNGKNDIDIEIYDKDLSKFMNTYYISGYHTNEYFWGHEYNKHGFCYNQRKDLDVNNYEKYFQKVKDMFLNYNFANIFLDIYKDRIIPGDMEINRNEVVSYLEKKNIPKDTYLLVCTNITDTNSTQVNPHLLEIRIRFDLDFNLLKNETDVSEFDCPEIFYTQFL